MKLGFLTACLPDLTLPEIGAWAHQHGYQALEVAAWPTSAGDRPFTASHLALDVASPDFDTIQQVAAEQDLAISSLAYYDNNLHPDEPTRGEIHQHVHRCIDAAAEIGCPTVGTFVGRHPGLSVQENLRLAEEAFKPLVDHAEQRGVKLVIENCVMEGWHPDGYPGNLAYSPELWEWMFSLGLYLNYDPSHLMWLGIDPVAALRPYVDRVAHAQAKDIELFPERRNHYGFFGRAVVREDPWDVGWWRYRVPGLGQVDWSKVVDTLYEGGFTGTLSVEHEDPVWGGDEARTKDGLLIAHRTLRGLILPG